MKKFLALVFSVLMIALGATAAGCDNRTVIKVGGSSSVSPLMEAVKEAFEKKYTNYRIDINTTDSGNGIEGATNGTYDIGMASKTVDDPNLDSHVVCLDGVALIVSSELEVDDSNITKEQLAALYLEDTGFGGILSAISREAGSGTRDAFDSLIGLKGKTLHKDVSEVNSTGAVITGVETDKTAIGYASLGSADSNIRDGKKIKKLKYLGIECTAENVVSGAYQLSRDFTLLTKKGAELSEGVELLLAFFGSEEGKAIIEAEGYVNLAE